MADNEEAKQGDGVADTDELVPEGEAVVYEEELLQNPYSLKLWLRYLQASIFPVQPDKLRDFSRSLTHDHASFL